MRSPTSTPFARLRTLGAVGALGALATLAACGGGGEDATTRPTVTNEQAQGYAADATTLPVSAAGAAETATAALENAVAASTASAAAEGRAVALTASGAGESGALALPGGTAGALATSLPRTLPCLLGGTVSWTVSGSDPTLFANGRLDAGETYAVTYTGCATVGGVLDGRTSTLVVARNANGIELDTSYTGLAITTLNGRFTLDGSLRQLRSSAGNAQGGLTFTHRVSTPRLLVASQIGTRQASYELRNLDWTVTQAFDANGAFTTRGHQGSVELTSNTPRRPSATLTIATQGSLQLGSDGLAAQGGFSVANGRDKWSVSYGANSVTLAFDAGNDGTVDWSWTLTRSQFHGEAG